ncbi:NAD(P)-dependent oxidoreductase [Actinomadura sp. 7K507]|uniref:NAD(P)-dependent oxidoreductase n=1 Tax=Actinomadura sp. 7K507 TaxID=2530365 RepID=UPI00104B1B3F|nr:NAD(P)-dependent oxidoreductase [Actinomadura sp. 7K507]TDC97948.1 NAD(P)-dependent oxidoreductase [Actinomadura sp. 7K507]
MRLGFIGAGRMGRPMIERLAAAGHELCTPARSDDAGDAGDGAGAVLVCVFDDEQVRDVCLGTGLLGRMPSGSVLVVHTTGSPRTAEAIAAEAGPRGIDVLDAPVSGGPHDIAAGRLTVFVGGADGAVARMRPVLGAYADPVLHVGPLGAGQGVKLVNNALFGAHIGLLSHAVRLGALFGTGEAALLEALTHGSSASRALSGVAPRGSVAAFAEAVGGFLGKDVAVVREVAAELGGDIGALAPALDALAENVPPAGGTGGPQATTRAAGRA